jgi:hypothetical protein
VKELDLSAERAVLATHDLAALHARVHVTLRRRAVLTTAGAVLLGAIALGAGAALFAQTTRERAARASVARTERAAPVAHTERVAVVAHTERATPVAHTERAAPATRIAPVPHTERVARVTPIAPDPHTEPVAPVPDTEPVAPVAPVNHLRVQLDLYERARAAADADPARARALLAELRSTYPNGALFVEASLLDIRILIASDRDDDARALLTALEPAATSAGKRDAWRALVDALR